MSHPNRPIPIFTGADWLSQLIGYAVRRDYCLKINCSTCGATHFRQALWAEAELASPLLSAEEIAHQLATLPSGTSSEAMRMVIYELYRRVRQSGLDDLAKVFAGSAAGDEYARMQAHTRRVDDVRFQNARLNSPERAEENRAQRAARHAARLAVKAVRDAARRDGGEA